MESSSVVSRRVLLKEGLWFSLFNAVIIYVLMLRYIGLMPDMSNSFACAYSYVFALSHSVCLSLFPYFFLFLPVTILVRKRTNSEITASLSATIFLLGLIIDSYIFSLYRFHINSYVIEQIVGPGAGQVFEISTAIYILAAVVVSVIFCTEYFLYKFCKKLVSKGNDKILFVVLGCFFAVFVLCQGCHAWAAASGQRMITSQDKYFPLNMPCNFNTALEAVGVEVDDFQVKENLSGKKYKYPKSELRTSFTGKNVLFIVLDSWHYECMDSVVCPNIYKFAQKSAYFSSHRSGSNGTRTGVFSMFYGLPGVYWHDFKSQGISPIMMDEFDRNGYDVKLYPSASLLNPPFDKNVFKDYSAQCVSAEGEKAWQRDESLKNAFLKFLRARKEGDAPFFSFLFFDSLHSMIMPEGYKGKFTPAWTYAKYEALGKGVDPTEFLNLYKNMLFYIDGLFGEVIHEMESLGYLENTVIVVTGDHGQEFDDNKKNFWGHNGNYSDAQIRVPMIYYSKNTLAGERRCWTTHYDLVPTIMKEVFLTENNQSDFSVGKSLFDTVSRNYMMVDSYIGYGIIDSAGQITNIRYDGDYEITDSKLNDCYDCKIDEELYVRFRRDVEMFYDESIE